MSASLAYSPQDLEIFRVFEASKIRARQEPEWFLREILHIDADRWQIQGLEAIADIQRVIRGEPTVINHEGLNRITARSCHGTGKTFWLALIMHWWNYVFVALAVCTAPKEKQLVTRLWPRYRQILSGADEAYRSLITVGVTNIRVCGNPDWGCTAETATDPDNLAGFHDNPQLFVADEASAKVLDPMFPVIEGTLTTEGSCLVEIGNPTRTSGEFFNSHKKPRVSDMYFKMHVKPEDSRFVTQKWLDDMARKYGRDSQIYKIRALGEFADAEPNQLILYSLIEEAKDREFAEDGSIPILIVSCDVADGGEDETVITIKKVYESFEYWIKQFSYNFEPSVAVIQSGDKVIKKFLQYGGKAANGDFAVIDALGVGAGTAGHVMSYTEEPIPVVAYKGGAGSDDPKEWKNRRTQSYIAMRNSFRDRKVIIANDFVDSEEEWDEFTAQMCSIKSKPGDERIEELVTKREMVAANLKSPDRADSPAMGYATQVPYIASDSTEPEIVETSEMSNYDAGLVD